MSDDIDGHVHSIRMNLPSTMDAAELSDAILKVTSSKITDPDQVRKLLEYIATEVLSGRTLDEDVRHWLGWSLMGISMGIDPRVALCLQKRGAPAKVSWEQIFPLVHDRIVSGDAWTTVCKDAAIDLSEQMNVDIDEKTVRLVYMETLKGWYDSWVFEDPIWSAEHPSAEEQRSFREFTFKAIKQTEAVKHVVRRNRK